MIIPEDDELEKVVNEFDETNKDFLGEHKGVLSELMNEVTDMQELMQTAVSIAQGTSNQKSFTFQGETFQKDTLESGYQKLAENLNKKLNEGFIDWDKKYCGYHLKLAKEIGKEPKLKSILNQHRMLTGIYQTINIEKSRIFQHLEAIQQKDDLTESELNSFGRNITSTILDFNKLLDRLDIKNFVPLPNIENIQDLKEAITENGVFIKEKGPIFENGNIGKVLNSLEQTTANLQRIDQKSVSVLLEFCEPLNESRSNN